MHRAQCDESAKHDDGLQSDCACDTQIVCECNPDARHQQDVPSMQTPIKVEHKLSRVRAQTYRASFGVTANLCDKICETIKVHKLVAPAYLEDWSRVVPLADKAAHYPFFLSLCNLYFFFLP